MSQDQQPRQDNDTRLEMAFLLIALLLAWPAVLLGAISRQLVKRHTNDSFVYWLGAGMLGTVGVWFLCTYANPYSFLLIIVHDAEMLLLHFSTTTGTRFVLDGLPLWERSILLFPWVTLVIELFTPKKLEASLLAQERQRRAIQIRKSKRAARLAQKAPDLLHGKGVLGALIDDPNH